VLHESLGHASDARRWRERETSLRQEWIRAPGCVPTPRWRSKPHRT